MKIVDCTLRDGGYYTNWDFDDELVDLYLHSMAALPVDAVEIGYRSRQLKGYYGKYFYCPRFVLERARELLGAQTKLAVMLNEKDCNPAVLRTLIEPHADLVDLVRFAVDPERIGNLPPMLSLLKDLGLQSAVNLMYASRYRLRTDELVAAAKQVEMADYLNLVDSYGGVYPEDVRRMVTALKKASPIALGFHGHNNLELAFANALVALDAGCDWLDSTVTGMGRGAGNLKTELMLTHLATSNPDLVDLDGLSSLVDGFELLRERHQWGTNLPYMVSGASSLPQKDVMDWVTKRWYSMNSMVRALANQRSRQADNLRLPTFAASKTKNQKVLIIGGGPSAKEHARGIRQWIQATGVTTVIHASAKNARAFENLPVHQIFCLVGNEGRRLERVFGGSLSDSIVGVLPPYPRRMGTYLPTALEERGFELPAITFSAKYTDSLTALALQTAIDHKVPEVWFAGYDGYPSSMGPKERDLFVENEYLLSRAASLPIKLTSLTVSTYAVLESRSLYETL